MLSSVYCLGQWERKNNVSCINTFCVKKKKKSVIINIHVRHIPYQFIYHIFQHFNTCTLLSNGHSVEYHMHDVCHSDTYTYINISIIYSNKLETACLIFSSETRLNSIICNIYFVNESYSVLLTSNILTLTVPVNRGDNS